MARVILCSGWISHPRSALQVPNDSDAAFKTHTRKPKPSELLRHGAAAVKWWGRGKKVLENRPNLRCPFTPVPNLTGAPRIMHDRGLTIQKLDAAQTASGTIAAGAGTGTGVDSGDRASWHEDDVPILFFWGDSKASQYRYSKETEERTQHMEQRRQSMPQVNLLHFRITNFLLHALVRVIPYAAFLLALAFIDIVIRIVTSRI